MAKQSTYFCNNCGYETTGWLGKCPSCGSWNTMVEEPKQNTKKSKHAWIVPDEQLSSRNSSELIDLNDSNSKEELRFSSGITELDTVLGNGFVHSSIILLAGQPGIGKSTLLLQVCKETKLQSNILYVCGEESTAQIKLRAERLEIKRKGIKLFPEIIFEKIKDVLLKIKPGLCIIDSIQTLYSDEINSAPGSVSQVREVTAGLLRLAKHIGTTIVLVGHVTKDGSIAGPRVLEHMVDTVIYFEGEDSSDLRMIRAVKNRFGATNELGLFKMSSKGLIPIEDASATLLEGRPHNVSGSAITSTLEGNRPLLVEVQALLNQTPFGAGQRMTQGFDRQRLSLLLALIEKQSNYNLSAYDAFVNVVGGIKIDDPSTDLAVAASIISSYKNLAIKEGFLLIGELGLSGELRRIANAEKRILEADRYGFNTCILPSANKKSLQKLQNKISCKLIFIDMLNELFDICFEAKKKKNKTEYNNKY